MRDIALVPQGHVFQSNHAVGPDDSRHAANSFGKNRVALMRHRAGSFLALLEALLRLADFGALPVADLQGELIQRRCDDGARAEVLGVAIALYDLSGNRRRLQAQPGANFFFNCWIKMGKRAHRAADLATATEARA